jgi:hypothetical protein
MTDRPRSLGKVRDTVLDWIEGHDLAVTLGAIALVALGAAATLVAAVRGEQPDGADRIPRIDREIDSTQQSQGDLVVYVDPTRGYGFSYPATWSLREEERVIQVESPNGRILLRFQLGASGDLDAASSRLLDSLADTTSNRELIGTTREQIDGSRSVLVSGTATDEAGKPVRFLAITVRGEPQNYAISIFVPRRSDPARVLPRIEEIVTSFDILAS